MRKKNNNKTDRKILILLTIILSFKLYSQIDPSYRTPNLPTSPEVARISTYGNIPVNKHSGSASTVIPLYVIKSDDIEIPINLSYTSTGIKVNDAATWVGLGWELQPEGVITQEVRGKNDQSGEIAYSNTIGYETLINRLAQFAPLGIQRTVNQLGTELVMKSCSFGNNEQAIQCSIDLPPHQIQPIDKAEVLLRMKDGSGQPDVYTFSFFGIQGSFYINPNTKTVKILNSSEPLEWTVSPNMYDFTAITSKGTKYFFNLMETVYYNGTQASSQFDNYTFKLLKIQSANGKEVFFDYVPAKYSNFYYTQINNKEDGSLGGYGDVEGLISYSYGKPVLNIYSSDVQILKRIRAEDVTVEFNHSDREDIIPTTSSIKKLSSVDIISNYNQKKIKSIVFAYDYFPYNMNGLPQTVSSSSPDQIITNNITYYGKRLRLNKVSEVFYNEDGSVNTSSTLQQDFEYKTNQTLPIKQSFSRDFYGYYNGSTGISLTPDINYFINQGWNNGSSMNNTYNNYMNNKFPDNTYAGLYMLEKIIYPTKGYTKFEYEPNSFNNSFIPTTQEVSSMDKSIRKYNNGIGGTQNLDPIYNFQINGGKKIKFYNEIFRGISGSPLQTQSYTYNQMLNAHASIKLFKVNIVNGAEQLNELRKWDLTTILSVNFESTNKAYWEEEIDLPPGSYRVQLNIDNSMYASTDLYHLAGVNTLIKYYDSPSPSQMSTQAGVRIKNVKSYDSNNMLLQHKQYTYEGGLLNNKFELLTPHYVTEFSQTQPYPFDFMYYSISGSDINSYVTYGKVTEHEIDIQNGSNRGKKEFLYNNFGNNTHILFPVTRDSKNGLLTDEITYDNSNKKLLEKKYIYKDISNNETFLSVQLLQKYINEKPICHLKNNMLCFPKFVHYITPLINNSYKMDSIITKEYINSQVFTFSQKLFYNAKEQTNKVDEIFPDKINTTEYLYADDLGNQYLQDKYMTGIPLQIIKKEKKDGVTTLINSLKNIFPVSYSEAASKTSGYPKPYEVQSSFANNAFSTDVTFDRYDEKGNIVQYSSRAGIPTTIIWGYKKTEPIAKIEGATYEQLIASGLIASIVNASDSNASTPANELALITALDTFRKNASLSNYQVTTYTYNPLIGVTSITPPSGIRELYIYDASGRLKEIRQDNSMGKLLKEFKYNYKN